MSTTKTNPWTFPATDGDEGTTDDVTDDDVAQANLLLDMGKKFPQMNVAQLLNQPTWQPPPNPTGGSYRFDGHWVMTPQGLQLIRDKEWYE